MHRANRENEVCFENLEKALAENPEAYRDIDLLCAGWPCQGNSIAGSRQGMSHEKSSLWREVRRLLELFRPKWFVGENVPGLFFVNDGGDFWQIISDLNSLGYCVAWDVLDSQNFGVAQRRKRVFIVASFGNIGAGKVLFKREGNSRDFSQNREMEPVGVCISTRDGERQDPTTETLVASVIKATDYQNQPIGQFGNENNLIAETNPDREGKTSGVSGKLDSRRGIVIGNAVTVSVAEWIGKRIIAVERGDKA